MQHCFQFCYDISLCHISAKNCQTKHFAFSPITKRTYVQYIYSEKLRNSKLKAEKIIQCQFNNRITSIKISFAFLFTPLVFFFTWALSIQKKNIMSFPGSMKEFSSLPLDMKIYKSFALFFYTIDFAKILQQVVRKDKSKNINS